MLDPVSSGSGSGAHGHSHAHGFGHAHTHGGGAAAEIVDALSGGGGGHDASSSGGGVLGLVQRVRQRVRYALQPLRNTAVRYQDQLTPLRWQRWTAFGVLSLFYIIKLLVQPGWYVVSYALGIYLFSQFVLFLMPAYEPEEAADALPTRATDEFKPFDRKLPEYRFWMRCFIGLVIGFALIFDPRFDIPVYWPILLMYFVILSFVQLKQRVSHMWKHGYLPWNANKPRYTHK